MTLLPLSLASLMLTAPARPLCTGPDATVACVARSLGKLYAQDYKRFWAILHAAAREAEACTDPEKVAAFLALAGVKTVNAEFQEFLAEKVESLCLRKPDCFRKAAVLLSQDERTGLRGLLAHPTFQEPAVLQAASCVAENAAGKGAR